MSQTSELFVDSKRISELPLCDYNRILEMLGAGNRISEFLSDGNNQNLINYLKSPFYKVLLWAIYSHSGSCDEARCLVPLCKLFYEHESMQQW